MDLNLIQKIIIWAIPVLFAVTMHEVAHGWVARKLGDPTAQMLGRLTVNPIKHVDPIGTVLVPALMLILGGFLFGWAKPVPITARNFKNPRRDMALVALAGPLSNLAMGIIWAIIIRIGVAVSLPWLSVPLVLMGQAGVLINAILLVVNLLPLPPLDGGRVLTGLIPPRMAATVDRVEPFGFIIIIALLVTGILNVIVAPPINALRIGLLMHIGGLG
ncbi:MAG TPA: site-2 protease family protein [Gammaproteobacteria bacterium]|nr:site-2 protease family protein [Gammaproteobacteria bacterium]